MATHLILIAEDDPQMRRLLDKTLRKVGFQTMAVENGVQALQAHRNQPADLIILDYQMPEMDGFLTLKALRPLDQVPVLMLTAQSQESMRVQGLDLGADDYLIKPFSSLELLARIRALLRRSSQFKNPLALVSGPFQVDRMAKKLLRNGTQITISPVEFHILETLMTYAGQPLARKELINLAWPSDSRPSPRTVDVHIVSLRKKLTSPGDEPWIISSGTHGYCWSCSVMAIRPEESCD